MGQVILGLDIGRSTIRGVRIGRTYRGLRFYDAFERAVERTDEGSGGIKGDHAQAGKDDFPSEGQLEALRQLRSEGKIRSGEMIATALPGHLVSMKEMVLPFTDPKRLRQVVPFEIEGLLPFDLDEIVIDYRILRQGTASHLGDGGGGIKGDHAQAATRELGLAQMQGTAGEANKEGKEEVPSSHLLIAAVRKESLGRYLSALQSVGIDPALVGVDALALQTFSHCFWGDRTDPLLIDLGASKTVLCDLRGGSLRRARVFPFGSDRFTEILQEELGLSREEAERRKRETDLGISSRESEILQKGISAWLIEIEKSLSPVEEGEGVPPPFYLCGGGGLLTGLSESISRSLQMTPAVPNGRPVSIPGLDLNDPKIPLPVYAQALGLALPSAEGTQISFRQGEFVYGKESLERRHRWLSAGVLLLILIGIMGADFYLHYRQKETKYRELKQGLRSGFTQLFPQTKNISNEVEQVRAAITERKRTGEFLGSGEESPLAVLKIITAAIPTEIRIDVSELVIDGKKIRIEAQTDSYDSVDRIRGGMMKVGRFAEVSVSDAKIASDQSRVSFRVQMTLTEVEEEGKKEEKDERKSG